MRSPKYPADVYPTDGVDLVGAYMRFIAQSEPDHRDEIRKLPRGNLRRASLLVARACMVGYDNPAIAQKAASGIRQEILEHHEKPDPKFQNLLNVTKLIEVRGDEDRLTRLRREMQLQDTESIRTLRDEGMRLKAVQGKGNAHRGELLKYNAGERAERRVISFLNRPLHPWLMAVRSLEHHDKHEGGVKSQTHRNFDLVVVEDGPHVPEPLTAKLQTKNACFGECGRPKSRAELKMGWSLCEKFRAQYDPDITIITACCDFTTTAGSSARLDNYVVEESRGRGHERHVPLLEAATACIMLLATGGEEAGRNGTFDPTLPRLAYSSDKW